MINNRTVDERRDYYNIAIAIGVFLLLLACATWLLWFTSPLYSHNAATPIGTFLTLALFYLYVGLAASRFARFYVKALAAIAIVALILLFAVGSYRSSVLADKMMATEARHEAALEAAIEVRQDAADSAYKSHLSRVASHICAGQHLRLLRFEDNLGDDSIFSAFCYDSSHVVRRFTFTP